MRGWKSITLSGVVAACILSAASEAGKKVLNATVEFVTDRIEITFKDPKAKVVNAPATQIAPSSAASADSAFTPKSPNSPPPDVALPKLANSAAPQNSGNTPERSGLGHDYIDLYVPKGAKSKGPRTEAGNDGTNISDGSLGVGTLTDGRVDSGTVVDGTIGPSYVDRSGPMARRPKASRSEAGMGSTVVGGYSTYPATGTAKRSDSRPIDTGWFDTGSGYAPGAGSK
jgi:hypothetical protein